MNRQYNYRNNYYNKGSSTSSNAPNIGSVKMEEKENRYLPRNYNQGSYSKPLYLKSPYTKTNIVNNQTQLKREMDKSKTHEKNMNQISFQRSNIEKIKSISKNISNTGIERENNNASQDTNNKRYFYNRSGIRNGANATPITVNTVYEPKKNNEKLRYDTK